MQFFKDHFDKLLLTSLLVLGGWTVLHLENIKASSDAVGWAIHLTSEFQGALLGLITGVAIGARIAGNNNTVNTNPSSVKESKEGEVKDKEIKENE